MWQWHILSIVALFCIALFLIALLYILYSGLMTEILISTGLPPVKNITVAYKFKVGPYKDCGLVFRECSRLGPKLPSVGIFYDDPKKVPAQNCRSALGSILSEGEDGPSEEQKQLYVNHGFQVFTFPEVIHVVTTSFPHRTPLSIFLGVQRVYPQLNYYIKERKLCAHPFLEIYRGGLIHFMSPLARQGDFYVPEAREAQRWVLGKDAKEEGKADMTGGDSNSERSSVSRMDVSPAPSSTRTHSHTPSDRHRPWERDESSSSSSFEELEVESDDDRMDNTPPAITAIAKNSLQDQGREMMLEEE